MSTPENKPLPEDLSSGELVSHTVSLTDLLASVELPKEIREKILQSFPTPESMSREDEIKLIQHLLLQVQEFQKKNPSIPLDVSQRIWNPKKLLKLASTAPLVAQLLLVIAVLSGVSGALAAVAGKSLLSNLATVHRLQQIEPELEKMKAAYDRAVAQISSVTTLQAEALEKTERITQQQLEIGGNIELAMMDHEIENLHDLNTLSQRLKLSLSLQPELAVIAETLRQEHPDAISSEKVAEHAGHYLETLLLFFQTECRETIGEQIVREQLVDLLQSSSVNFEDHADALLQRIGGERRQQLLEKRRGLVEFLKKLRIFVREQSSLSLVSDGQPSLQRRYSVREETVISLREELNTLDMDDLSIPTDLLPSSFRSWRSFFEGLLSGDPTLDHSLFAVNRDMAARGEGILFTRRSTFEARQRKYDQFHALAQQSPHIPPQIREELAEIARRSREFLERSHERGQALGAPSEEMRQVLERFKTTCHEKGLDRDDVQVMTALADRLWRVLYGE